MTVPRRPDLLGLLLLAVAPEPKRIHQGERVWRCAIRGGHRWHRTETRGDGMAGARINNRCDRCGREYQHFTLWWLDR